jgi:hypothetical protein
VATTGSDSNVSAGINFTKSGTATNPRDRAKVAKVATATS